MEKRKTGDENRGHNCSLSLHFWSTSRSPFFTCHIPFQRSGSQESNASIQLPFFDTRLDSFSMLERILPFSDTGSDYIIFRYSNLFDSFRVLARTVFRYSQGFCLFSILARILSFFSTHTYSTLFRYSTGKFFHTRTDSTFFRYTLGLYHF